MHQLKLMAKILKIVVNPSEILRKKNKKIDFAKADIKKLKQLCADMTETMKKSDGVGLAAPQVGENIRLAVVNTKDGPICLLNPELTKKSLTKEWGEEGCLSVPCVFGEVKRHKKVTCSFCDISGKVEEIKAEGLFARVIQHELDHLDGILFIDKAKKLFVEKSDDK